MTSYGQIEIMKISEKRYREVFDLDGMLGPLFAEDSAKISRCIHHPDGMISLSAEHLDMHYELRFREPTSRKAINKDEYSISNHPLFGGTGSVDRVLRFENPEPFSQFYHVITVSKGHRLLWRIGIDSFSKEVTEEGV